MVSKSVSFPGEETSLLSILSLGKAIVWPVRNNFFLLGMHGSQRRFDGGIFGLTSPRSHGYGSHTRQFDLPVSHEV